MLSRVLIRTALIISCAPAIAAHPLQELENKVTLNGFVTGGLAIHDARNTAFGRTLYDDQIGNQLSADSDNVGGLQVTVPISQQFSGVLQFVAKAQNNYDVETSWAYVKYTPSSAFAIEVGRFRNPFYILSQYLDVGYAYPWVKPPQAIYSMAPIPNTSGVNIRYRTSIWGDTELHLNPFLGSGRENIQAFNTVLNTSFKNMFGISGDLTNDWLTLRGSIAQTRFTFENAITATIPPATTITFPTVVNKKAVYWGLGAQIDKWNWLVLTEYGRRRIFNTYVNSAKSGYILIGHRFGNWLPHITYAATRTTHRSDQTSIPLIGTVIASAIQADQDSYDLGLRYNLNQNVALKGDISRIVLKNGTKGFFSFVPPSNVANLVNIGINFVF